MGASPSPASTMAGAAGTVRDTGPSAPGITATEFRQLRDWLKSATGIALSSSKTVLVTSRLACRLRARGVATFTAYLRLVATDPIERQCAIDLLTTNETYFFREPRHFDWLRDLLPRLAGQPVRVWSAACSTGEEPYSVAMLLDSHLGGRPWDVLGTDISSRVLDTARAGHYRMERAQGLPPDLRRRYCLRGTGAQEGTLLVAKSLRDRVRFEQVNLTLALPDLGTFDVIFLRNVMIYFEQETKRRVVEQLATRLRPGGHLLIGHSETLNDVTDVVRPVAPSIYRLP
jgi:chemotaxis protein methyltransferase CheR